MISEIRVGVAGLGYWGPNLARNLAALPGCTVTWLCDADEERTRRLVSLLLAVPFTVVLPLHPRTRARLEAAGRLERLAARPGLRLTPPLGYLEFTALLHGARAVLTDSGGVQKEAYLARVPCVTLRARTEWTETVEAGWNFLVDLDAEQAVAALERHPPDAHPDLYGDGRAGERVVAALEGLA